MRNLVWCSIDSSKKYPWLYEKDQNFDIILHDYGAKTSTERLPQGPILVPAAGKEKLNVAATSIPKYLDRYDQFAFLDDDLDFTIEDLNRLFLVGEALRLPLYQPALTRKSIASHLFLKQIPDAVVRKVSFVEIMCPFFSRDALRSCLPSFDLNLSGWGLDCFIWPKKVAGACYVIDAIAIGHYSTPARRQRVMANGKTPAQECAELQKELTKYV